MKRPLMPAGRVFVSGSCIDVCFFFFLWRKSERRIFPQQNPGKLLDSQWEWKTHMWEPRKWWFFKTFAPILFHALAARKEDDTDDEAKKRKLRQRGGYFEIFFSMVLGLIIVTGWWFHFFNFYPYLGKIPILTDIFGMGWFHHQLA